MQVNGFGATDPGLMRERNEDAILVDNSLGLYVVCDGMGGHAAGDVASNVALEAIRLKLERRRDDLRSMHSSGKMVLALVRDVIRYACAKVYHRSGEDQRYRGMGTTTTMLLVQGSKAIVGHVGDSRLYLLRRGVLSQLSRDHTLAQDLVDSGEVSQDQVHKFSQAGALTRAVGVYEDVEVDTFQFELLHGDRILLCSDGLYDAIDDLDAYVSVLAPPTDPSKTAGKLIEAANKIGGGPDNISAVVVSVDATPDKLEAEENRRSDYLLSIDMVQRLFLFQELEQGELLEVVETAVLQLSEENEVIVHEGREDDSMYLLIDGSCRLERRGAVLERLSAGCHFGEISLLVGTPRSATVIAETPCKMLRINRSDFQSIIERRPTTGVKLLLALGKELSHRLIKTNQRAD